MADNDTTREKMLEAMRGWHASVQAGAAAAKASGVDWSKVTVDPKDLRVQMGPMLTEEQFKLYCKETGTTNPTIIRKNVG